MKRVFWLASAIGLTVAQTAAAQSTASSNSSYVRSANDIDSAINSLISSQSHSQPTSQQSQHVARTYYTQGTAPAASNYSANYQASAIEQLTASSAPSIAAKSAARAAHGRSIGRCALYVRRALQAAGYEFTPQASAYMYATNGTLASAGFVKLNNANYVPQVGDVAVFNRSGKHPHGHIQIYDGNQWVSDFRQPKFSPYSQHNGYSVWRDARYMDASNDRGTYLAFNE